MWIMPCVRKLSLYGKLSINCGLQEAKGLLTLWYSFIPKTFYVVLNFLKLWEESCYRKANSEVFKINLGFTWRQDCVLFDLLECVSKIQR